MRKKAPRKEGELHLQIAVVNYLRMLKGNILFNGSAGGIRTSITQARKMKLGGYRRGFPDLIILEPRGQYHGLAIELKVKGNYASIYQKEVIKQMRERGYKAEVCTGFDQAKETIDTYFG